MAIDSLPPKSAPALPKPIEEKAPVEAAKPAAPAAPVGVTGKISEGFDALKKKLMSVSGRYAAPAPVQSNRDDLKALVAAQRNAVSANGTGAPAARASAPPPPAKTNEAHAVGGPGAAGDPNKLPEVVAARAQAAKTQDMEFDVGPRADSVAGLIQFTPQVDANPDTKNDGTRCAAASTFNAMLIDQHPAENARAMQKYGNKIGYEFTDAEKAALQRFESGKLTPKEAGVLQEAVFNMAKKNDDVREARAGKKGPDRMTADGITPVGAAEVLAGLRAQGGMSSLKEVQIQMQQSKASDGTPFGHATLSCQKADGSWMSANTWPDKDGFAQVKDSPTVLEMVTFDKDGKKVHAPGADGLVSLTNFAGKPQVSFAYPSSGPDGQPQLTRGKCKDFDPNSYKSGSLKGFDLFIHDLQSDQKIRVDSDTGTPLPNSPYVD